ncbi:hypothetical protein ACF0H5_004694 [Mactra antiquata]
MTDLFNQFGDALTGFKMENIDSAGLHEIIGEFAPLLGVATDSLSVKTPSTVKTTDVKQSQPERIDPSYVGNKDCMKVNGMKKSEKSSMNGNESGILDLSMKASVMNNSLELNDLKVLPQFNNQTNKRLASESLIDPSVFKRSRNSIDSHRFETRNAESPVNLAVESDSPSSKTNKDSDEESNKCSRLLYEIKTIYDLKYYQCKLCPKIYDTKYHLNRHLITHGGNRPHCCDQCGKSFSQKCDLNRHMNVHNNLRNYACSVCGKSFKRADYLSKHERQYCGVFKPHKCSKCNKGFEDTEQLASHACSQKTDGVTFTCEHCEEKFETVDGLVEHRKIHSNQKQNHQCSKCKEEFTDFSTYVDHFKKHSGERPYTCDLCQKIFSRNHNLMTHMWIHNQQKQHTCQICAKTFTYYSNLQVHLRVHRNERPYKCEECDKGFLTSSDLRRHKRTHSGEKPYKCDQCPAEYARKERLIGHMITHMEEGVEDRDNSNDGTTRESEISEDSNMIEEEYDAEEEADN